MNRPFGLPATAPLKAFERRFSNGILPRGWIDGLTLSNDTTDATNDIAVAAGSAKSTACIVDGAISTLTRDQIDLDLPVSIIKQLDVAFAPDNYDPEGYSGGDRSGGRSSSAISNTTWHVILAGGGGLQTDVFLHDSITRSAVFDEMMKIGGYTAYRRIGSIIRASAAIVAFTQVGDNFQRTAPILDVDNSADHTTAATATLSVPVGIIVDAILSVGVNDNSSSTSGVYLSALSQTNSVPSPTAAPGLTASGKNAAAQQWTGGVIKRTNTSAQIRYRSSNAAVDTLIVTHGWIDRRDRDSDP